MDQSGLSSPKIVLRKENKPKNTTVQSYDRELQRRRCKSLQRRFVDKSIFLYFEKTRNSITTLAM
jgi:hypothetical protein